MIKVCKVFHNYYEVSRKLGKIVDVCLGFVQMWFLLDIACWKWMGGLPFYCSGSSWIGLSFHFLFYFSNIIKTMMVHVKLKNFNV